MSHKISFDGQLAEMAFAGETPWHGLGEQMPARGTAGELLRAAHLNWYVNQRPVVIDDEIVDGYRINYRVLDDGRKRPLGVVSDRYQIIQNDELAKLGEAMLGQDADTVNAAAWETGGALFGGKVVFLTANLGELPVVDGDALRGYLWLQSGHDGAHSLIMGHVLTRVVCRNTSMVALSEATRSGELVRLRHTANSTHRMASLRDVLGLTRIAISRDVETFKILASTPLKCNVYSEDPTTPVSRTLESILPIMDLELPTQSRTRASRVGERTEIRHNITHGVGNSGHNLWDVYNGVTQWIDHSWSVPSIGTVRTAQRRLATLLDGRGAQMRNTALSTLVELAREA
jgi:phage/plasmid-like protein (TIGR03299 family)